MATRLSGFIEDHSRKTRPVSMMLPSDSDQESRAYQSVADDQTRLDSNQMLNRGYAYTTVIRSNDRGQTLLSHLTSLYPHSSPQAWQENLDNGEVTVDGVIAAGTESLRAGQTLVWNRPPWIEPDAPQHFDVLLE